MYSWASKASCRKYFHRAMEVTRQTMRTQETIFNKLRTMVVFKNGGKIKHSKEKRREGAVFRDFQKNKLIQMDFRLCLLASFIRDKFEKFYLKQLKCQISTEWYAFRTHFSLVARSIMLQFLFSSSSPVVCLANCVPLTILFWNFSNFILFVAASFVRFATNKNGHNLEKTCELRIVSNV